MSVQTASTNNKKRTPLYIAIAVIAAIAVAVAVVVVVVSRGGDAQPVASGSDQSGAVASEPVEGGEITFLLETLDLNWVVNGSSINNYAGHIWHHITDKLTHVDDEGNVTPWLAEDWDINDDYTEFTLYLKEGVTFSDGSPFNAAAVIANFEIWAYGDADRGINRVTLFPTGNYEGAEEIDEHTVRVNFSSPTLGFIGHLGFHGSVLLSPVSIANDVEEQAGLVTQLGTGPFVIERFVPNDEIVLAKREDYSWGPEASGNTGPAHLDRITYKVIAEESVRGQALVAGQTDIAYGITPAELQGYEDQGFVVATPRYFGYASGYRVDTSVAPFDEVNVRQAVQHAIDRDTIYDTVYTPSWFKAISFVNGNVPEASDFSEVFAYDPEESNRLLDEAGWELGSDGVRVKDGVRLATTLYPTIYLQTSRQVDELVAQNLQAVGFEVDIVVTDTSSFLRADNYALVPTTNSLIDIGTIPGALTSLNNGLDWFSLGDTDERLNELSIAVATATDFESRQVVFDELQEYILDQGLYVPTADLVQRIYVQNPNLKNVQYNALAIASYSAAWLED